MASSGGIYCERHGDPAAPPLILSAGLGGSGDYWQPNLAALAKEWCVYLYDHRGTARSDRSLRPDTSVADMAEDVLDLIDALAIDRPVICGHAAGALIALELALRAPERLSGLVLVNGWSRPDPHFARCIRMRLSVLAQGGAVAYLRAQPVFLHPANWVSENEALLEARLPAQIDEFQGEAALRSRAAALMCFDRDDAIGGIAMPVLVVVADDDMLVPSTCSERLAVRIPGARVARMSSGGHACNVTYPELFNSLVLDWLSGLRDA